MPPHLCLLVSYRVPNVSQFCSKARCFHVNGNFETSALNDRKMTQFYTRRKIRLMCFTSVPVLNFSLKSSTEAIFELTASLIHALKDPKMTLNTTRLKVAHICYTITPQSEISIHFVLHACSHPPIFELQAFSRQLHRMTQNNLEHYERRCTHIYLSY